MTQLQLGAYMIMNGTGNPNSQPRTRMCLPPHVSASWPEIRLVRPLTIPKLTMNPVKMVAEAR
jgi:hypothetical protein